MSSVLRLGAAAIVVGTCWDDGESLTPAPISLGNGQGGPTTVPLTDLKGSRFYESLMEQWPAFKAEAEAARAEEPA